MPAKVEMRADPNERSGKKYSRQAFIELYGKHDGQMFWDAGAPRQQKICAAEKRADPNETSGKKYTKQEFIKLYGKRNGQKFWDAGASDDDSSDDWGGGGKGKGNGKGKGKGKSGQRNPQNERQEPWEFGPGGMDMIATSRRGKTPYQGVRQGRDGEEKRVFGCFECHPHYWPKEEQKKGARGCGRPWQSGNTWRDYGQECTRCGVVVYPYEQRGLEWSPAEERPPHKRSLCEKCQRTGICCRCREDECGCD